MNAVAEELTGWTLLEVSRRPVTEVFNIINEHTRQQFENPVAKVLGEGMIVGLANHTILVRKDGTEVPIDDSGAPIRDAMAMLWVSYLFSATSPNARQPSRITQKGT